MLTRKQLVAGVGGVAVLAAAAFAVPTLAHAQSAGGDAVPGTAIAHQHGKGGAHADGKGGPRGGAGLDQIASVLGVTSDQLRAAMQQVGQAQKPATRPAAPPTAEERAARQSAFEAALAAELSTSTGVSVSADAVRNAFQAAQTAAQAQHLAQLKTRLDQAVADGRLTQTQADALYGLAQSHQPGKMGFRGGFGGFGEHRSGPGGHGHAGPQGGTTPSN